MMAMVQKILFYLQYPFVRYALIVGVLIALSSSLLGVTLVLKRYSYIGDGLSHVAFGAMSIATVLKLSNQMVLILPVTIVCAVLLLRTGQNSKIKGDAAIAMLSVGALAFGYLVMNVFSTSANLYAVRFDLDFDADQPGGAALRRALVPGGLPFHCLLPEDFCGDL